MSDTGLWRQEGPKAFLSFLANATGEDHDAVVYDTKLEFDPSNEAAVRYVASVAMTKAASVIAQKDEQKVFEWPIPIDGSVEPYDLEGNNEPLCELREARLYRETHPEGMCIYTPDASKYRQSVIDAIKKRDIPYDTMTASEKEEYTKHQKAEEKEFHRFEFWHHYLPIIIALVFACIGFWGIVTKLLS
ncbi:MAG: hypothetical protein NC548_48715 [Lachnospiraceae bacterium]|nr:hypothetical protein [Lachnospiraceae bacterium]MCM1232434.1 hypothetical protein [Ruminococcus flavefaciens]